MSTPSAMILRSLRLIGIKRIGQTLTTDEQTAYLADLNTMMDGWSIDWSLIYQLLQESKALTTSQGVYTIGSGGDFNTTRPTQIVDPCFVRDTNGNDFGIMLIDAVQYGRIQLKTLDGSYPRYMFYDNADVAGLGTIKLYPEPLASLTLYINSWKALQSFALISTTLALPPGYQRAIEFNFAVEVAGGFKNVSTEVAKVARDSLADVKRVNSRSKVGVMTMPVGIVSGRRSNILLGP